MCFFYILPPDSPILSRYLNTCQYANLFLSPIHPSQNMILLFSFSTLSNIYVALHIKKASGKTESMVDSAQIHIIHPPWAIPHCGLIIWFPSLFHSPHYLISLIISFSSLFDFPRYLIFRTAVLSELVIDWIIIIGCVESCQREMGCGYLLSRLKIQLFENVT